MSSKPTIASTRCCGLWTRLSLARRIVTQVDSVPTREVDEASIDFGAAPAAGKNGGDLIVGGRSDGHANAVVRDDVERIDVVRGAPGHHRMHAARVVAQHATERVVIVGGGIRPE